MPEKETASHPPTQVISETILSRMVGKWERRRAWSPPPWAHKHTRSLSHTLAAAVCCVSARSFVPAVGIVLGPVWPPCHPLSVCECVWERQGSRDVEWAEGQGPGASEEEEEESICGSALDMHIRWVGTQLPSATVCVYTCALWTSQICLSFEKLHDRDYSTLLHTNLLMSKRAIVASWESFSGECVGDRFDSQVHLSFPVNVGGIGAEGRNRLARSQTSSLTSLVDFTRLELFALTACSVRAGEWWLGDGCALLSDVFGFNRLF